MSLDTRSARPLTSREIAKTISGLLGTYAEWCDPQEIADAMGHFHDHAKQYREVWDQIHRMKKGDAVL